MTTIGMPAAGVYPFWFWNGRQEPAELERQLRLMQQCGCRGVLIHARVGNRIEYLSDEWLDLVERACRVAATLGLKVWLYDEDGYPSGNCGGRVQAQRPDLVQKYLTFAYVPFDPQDPGFVSYDAATQTLLGRDAGAGRPSLRFALHHEPRHVDTLHPDAARLFITLTHEKYAARLQPFFGHTIEAVYTDDASFQVCMVNGIVWSEVLEAAWDRQNAPALRTILPALVEDLPGYGDLRTRYYRLAQQLFLRHFIAPQQEWCRQHGLGYTGHLCGDEGPRRVTIKNYASPMPYYLAEDIPAIDDFLAEFSDCRYLQQEYADAGRRFLPLNGRLFAPLQLYKPAASIAHQFKRNQFSAEVLTFITWRHSFDFIPMQMSFELGMGVNLITPHAFYYTVGQGTKRDCPPSYFFQQPYFPVLGTLLRRWTETAERLRAGTCHADVLVLYPANDLTLMDGQEIDPGFAPRHRDDRLSLGQLDRTYATLLLNLSRRHIGFDLGDETIMASHATIAGGRIRLGQMDYHTVIVPAGVRPSPRTDDLLRQLAAAGGTVLYDGRDSLAALVADLEIAGEGTEEVLVQAREHRGHRETFLVNLSGRDLAPRIALDAPCRLYDTATGTAVAIAGRWPANMVLRAGMACMILPADAEVPTVPFADSLFAADGAVVPLPCRQIAPESDNIWAWRNQGSLDLDLPPGVRVKTVYAEHLADATMAINGCKLTWALRSSHPADPCYLGAELADALVPGHNAIRFEGQADIVYFAGDFLALPEGLRASRPLALGDLAAQGFPYYWGAFAYEAEFAGTYRFLRLDLEGAAEVFLNGQRCGLIFGPPHMLPLSGYCRPGTNQLRLRLYNSAQNFIEAENPARFGVFGMALIH